MIKVAKIFLFGFLALVLLVAGCVATQVGWYYTHHRYYQPDSGYYYGSVHALFSSTDDSYTFHFQGQTEPRWRWTYFTNFAYRSLQFGWWSFDAQVNQSEGSGTIKLPSLVYESSRGTGVLTRKVLSEWLLSDTNVTQAVAQSVDTVFGFIEDAGQGTLPAPNHHGHYYEQPVRGRIQHFRLGYGVAGLVYVWIGVWLLSVVIIARRFWRRNGGRLPPAANKSNK